jgi:putative tricarboxylic transport membrane protein
MFLLATTAMFILGLSMVRTLVKVLEIPRTRLMPVVFVLCVIGAYAVESRAFDVVIMVAFGVIGYIMQEMEYPVAPMILGIILGDILDKNLRRALVLTDGDLVPFFTRPISLVLIVLIVFSLVGKTEWFRRFVNAIKQGIVALVRRRAS